MLFSRKNKRPKRDYAHPYLTGNFAPIQTVLPLTPCSYTGTIPRELIGGQYVRNGGNPLTNDDLGRDTHWFDGDGMLSGVLFRRAGEKGTEIQPEFVNQYILTDVFLHSKSNRLLKTPILPSITTLVNPLSSLFKIIVTILRTLLLVLLSHLPGSKQAVKRISVANTGIVYHDGRALATCESGPPIRIQLPALETVGWFNGRRAENESCTDDRSGFGGERLLSFMEEWTTGHPRVDPLTQELITFHSSFAPPYVHYSIVPSTSSLKSPAPTTPPRFDIPIPGMSGAKMMHDFGIALSHTVIMDLPLSLDPLNLARSKPVVAYDPTEKSRFGVFPRYSPGSIRWFETNACCIFHTANTWTTKSINANSPTPDTTVHMLCSRLTSASIVYSAGDIASPAPSKPIPHSLAEEEQCRLYYYAFDLYSATSAPAQQWALSSLAFEFPVTSPHTEMRDARYIYGCSNTLSSFSAALGRAAKIDLLAKIDARELIKRGRANPPQAIKGCVDTRSYEEILASDDPQEPIQLLELPAGFYAQEPRFVPRNDPKSEDDGFLLFYVFDESQLDLHGEAPPTSESELWILEATDMNTVLAKVRLPQRVPYGLHGNWFAESDLQGQRALEGVRRVVDAQDPEVKGLRSKLWNTVREMILRKLG